MSTAGVKEAKHLALAKEKHQMKCQYISPARKDGICKSGEMPVAVPQRRILFLMLLLQSLLF
jgi:hypothetical protein